jgi:hypothetical protein
MRPIFVFSFFFFFLFSMIAQDHDRDTKALYYGLSDDVVKLEEITYSFNETDSLMEKMQHQVLDLSNGSVTKERTAYFGEYPSDYETINTYSPQGQLLKKEFKDLTNNTATIYTYAYDKDKLISGTYQTDYDTINSIYKYDTKGRLFKKEEKHLDGKEASYTEYIDYGADNGTYTEKYYFYGDEGFSLLGTSKYEKGLMVTYEQDIYGVSKYDYSHDSYGNKTSTLLNGENSGSEQYVYVGNNYTKKYKTDIFSDYKTEEFVFRKITFKNGKTIGSTEPDLNFIYQHNVVDEIYDDGYSDQNLGELLNGKCVLGDCQSGYGSETYEAGQNYEGFFKDGKRNGPGVLDYGDGSSFHGLWENGSKNGLGMYNNGDGNYFLGYHKDDLRDGYGFEQNVLDNGEYEFVPSIWEDGNLLEDIAFASTGNETGCINGDCTNGHGRYIYDNGDVYLGYFKDGKFDKFGVYVYKIGDTYIGGYKNHERSDYGMYVWADKTVFIGNYENDNYNGLGAYFAIDEKDNLIGIFKAGNLSKSME